MRMDNDFINWYHVEATEAERSLADRVGNLEGFFADMLFTPDTPSGDLIKIQSKDHNADAEWFDDEINVPEELECFSHTYFTYRVEVPEDGCYGYFDSEKQILCVQPSLVKDDVTVLHEMIHMHEFVVNELPMFYHDALLWSLYTDLRKRIPGLDELIAGHAHILTGSELYRQGGLHDILFLLKSFDLDIKRAIPSELSSPTNAQRTSRSTRIRQKSLGHYEYLRTLRKFSGRLFHTNVKKVLPSFIFLDPQLKFSSRHKRKSKVFFRRKVVRLSNGIFVDSKIIRNTTQ